MKTYEETLAALNAMIPEIHANAVEHGWWDEERTAQEIYALIHSELSEALEEFRNDKDPVYCDAHGGDWCSVCYGDTCEIAPDVDCIKCFTLRAESGKIPHKPEGVLVELADVVIRIMDYLGYHARELESSDVSEYECRNDVTALIAYAHAGVSQAFMARRIGDNLYAPDSYEHEFRNLASVVRWILDYVEAQNYDLDEVIRIKHAYNKTRSYKHGGKRI